LEKKRSLFAVQKEGRGKRVASGGDPTNVPEQGDPSKKRKKKARPNWEAKRQQQSVLLKNNRTLCRKMLKQKEKGTRCNERKRKKCKRSLCRTRGTVKGDWEEKIRGRRGWFPFRKVLGKNGLGF